MISASMNWSSKWKWTIPTDGQYQFGGSLKVGDTTVRGVTQPISLKSGKQTVLVPFDGQQIGDSAANGPYLVQALWAQPGDQAIPIIIEPSAMQGYQDYTYATSAYQAGQFKVAAASFADQYAYTGIDVDGNGLFELIKINTPLNIAIPGSFSVEGDLYDAQGDFIGHASWAGNDAAASLEFRVEKFQPPYTLAHLNLIQAQGPILDSRFDAAYTITDLAGKVETSPVTFGELSSENQLLGITPNTFTFTPIDLNANGRYDLLRVNVGVTVTAPAGSYRIEGLLADEFGAPVAWAVSAPKTLVVGSQTMTLEFDGKALSDQLPLTGSKAYKLVAVKIFSGNLSKTTLVAERAFAATAPAYSRSQFEVSSPSATVFQDNLESGMGQWVLSEDNVLGAGSIYSVNIGSAVGGTFTLTVDGKTTAPNAWNITAANLKTALTNAGVDVTTITGSGVVATPWVITFPAAPASVSIDKAGLVENVLQTAGSVYSVNIGFALGGTFTLTVDGNTTAPNAWNITAANLKTALTNAGVAVNTITGSGTIAAPWVITFTTAPTTVSMDKTDLVENVGKSTNTVYNVNIGAAVWGTFTLTVDDKTTAPLAWNITAANLKTALISAGVGVNTISGYGTVASPWVITFTAAPASVTFDKTGLIINAGVTSSLYKVTIGAATGGTFTLTVDGKTTAANAYNISYTNLKNALTNAGVGVTAVTGSGTFAAPWLITFMGAVNTVTMDKTGLTGAVPVWSYDASLTGDGTIYRLNIGPATAGTFSLTVDSKVTDPIDWNSSAANLKTMLTKAGVAVSTVAGYGTLASPWVITFTTAPASVSIDPSGLYLAHHSGNYAWKASSTTNYATQQLVLASPLNLANYAQPVLRINHAYLLGNAGDILSVEVSTNGTTWTALKTFTGVNTTPHWIVEDIDLSAYAKCRTSACGSTPNGLAQPGRCSGLSTILPSKPGRRSGRFHLPPRPISRPAFRQPLRPAIRPSIPPCRSPTSGATAVRSSPPLRQPPAWRLRSQGSSRSR